MLETNNKTLCIILHYGEEAVTWECVASIVDDPRLDILIADNDPGQKIMIPDAYQQKVSLFRTGGVAGFAQANNLAIEHGRNEAHDSVLLLNNDVVVLNDAIEKMKVLLSHSETGIVGPCMPYASDPQRVWACGGAIVKYKVKIHGLKTVKGKTPYDVDYLPGAAILCKLKVWDLVGGLPEKYFLAYEEAEFAIRVREQGFRVMVHPDAVILHKVGMSSDRQPMYLYNGNRNRLRFGKVIWGRYTGFTIAFFWCLGSARRSLRDLSIFFRALRDEVNGVPLNRETLQNIKKLYAK